MVLAYGLWLLMTFFCLLQIGQLFFFIQIAAWYIPRISQGSVLVSFLMSGLSLRSITVAQIVKEVVVVLLPLLLLRAGLGGSVGCAVRLKTRRSRIQPPPRSATFFRGD